MSEEGYGAYDPTAPEGDDAARAQYVTKKDVRVVAILILVLAVAAWPIYNILARNARRSLCRTNLKGISEAINQYASLHDERFPPIMRTGNNGEPGLGETGHPYTWASDLSEFMSARSSFKCPEAQPEEVTMVEGVKRIVPLTYGMYQPYGGFLRNIVPNPDQTVLIVETSNHGSAGTYDPKPYTDSSGTEVPWDGFVVGWNTGNSRPDAKSTTITRLAFPDTKNGEFTADSKSRHDGGILAISCSGAVLPPIKPKDAIAPIRGGLPSGLWEAPATSALSR